MIRISNLSKCLLHGLLPVTTIPQKTRTKCPFFLKPVSRLSIIRSKGPTWWRASTGHNVPLQVFSKKKKKKKKSSSPKPNEFLHFPYQLLSFIAFLCCQTCAVEALYMTVRLHGGNPGRVTSVGWSSCCCQWNEVLLTYYCPFSIWNSTLSANCFPYVVVPYITVASNLWAVIKWACQLLFPFVKLASPLDTGIAKFRKFTAIESDDEPPTFKHTFPLMIAIMVSMKINVTS